MPRPTRPSDLYTNNNWYFEMQGLVSPHFHTLEGISKTTGEITIVDGGTNITHKFSSQIKQFGDITLTRSKDGSVDDVAIAALRDLCMDTALRFDANLVKLHHGNEVFRIMFLGARIKEENHPTLSTDGEERYDVRYVLSVSEWVEIL